MEQYAKVLRRLEELESLEISDYIKTLLDDADAVAARMTLDAPSWHKIANPGTGWFASKTAGWTADRFTIATGGFLVNFSAQVPTGTKAIRVFTYIINPSDADLHRAWARKASDPNISNTPLASSEDSHHLFYTNTDTANRAMSGQKVIWLSDAGKAEFAVSSANLDIYIAYPLEYLL